MAAVGTFEGTLDVAFESFATFFTKRRYQPQMIFPASLTNRAAIFQWGGACPAFRRKEKIQKPVAQPQPMVLFSEFQKLFPFLASVKK